MEKEENTDHVEMVDLKAGLRAQVEIGAREELGKGEGVWKTFRKNPRAFFMLMVIMSTALTTGIEQSISGSMTGSQAFCKVMGYYSDTTNEYEINASHMSAWSGIAVPFQLIGFGLAGFICDRWGRKWVLNGSLVIMLLGAIVELVSRNWVDWLIAKAILAVSVGLIQSCFATYVAEVSPRAMRGGALVGFQIFTNAGSLLSAVILEVSTNAIPDPSNELQYKIPLYVLVALPVVIGAGIMIMLVESPTWLVMQDDLQKALKSLKWIYPYMSASELDIELAKIRYTVEMEREENERTKSASWVACFRGSDLRRTMVAILPGTTWVMSGYVIIVLSTYFFALAGQTNSLLGTVIVQSTGIFCNFLATVLVEQKFIGRFRIYIFGLVIMLAGMYMVGAVGARWSVPGQSSTGSKLLVAAVVITNIGCQLGPQAVSYLYASESGSSLLRAKTTSISQSCSGILVQLAGIYAPYMLDSWGSMIGFFFAGFGTVLAVVSYFVVPDYTGRSLAQIDELFMRKIPARKFASTECTGHFGSTENPDA